MIRKPLFGNDSARTHAETRFAVRVLISSIGRNRIRRLSGCNRGAVDRRYSINRPEFSRLDRRTALISPYPIDRRFEPWNEQSRRIFYSAVSRPFPARSLAVADLGTVASRVFQLRKRSDGRFPMKSARNRRSARPAGPRTSRNRFHSKNLGTRRLGVEKSRAERSERTPRNVRVLFALRREQSWKKARRAAASHSAAKRPFSGRNSITETVRVTRTNASDRGCEV